MIATDFSEPFGHGDVLQLPVTDGPAGLSAPGYRCCSITPPPVDATESERGAGWLRKRFRATWPLTPGVGLRHGVGAVKAPMI